MLSSDKKIIVAVDGFSSCGKSTFAHRIASLLGYVFIDTGAMYRAVTLCGLRRGAISDNAIDEGKLMELMGKCSIKFRYDAQRDRSDIYIDGENVEKQIRSIEVSSWVSPVSQLGAVREKLVAQQQAMGRERGVVMDGRDIGTVVFPDAEFKIFMTADPAIRARRRYDELTAQGQNVSLEEIEKNIRDRDQADQTRAISPLRQAIDAIVLDNSHMTIEEQMEWVKEHLHRLGVI